MAERQKKPLSANSFAVKITDGTTNLNKYFSKCSGVSKEYNTGTYSDGQTNIVYTLPTSVRFPDITLSKPFVEDDGDIITLLNKVNSSPSTYITVNIQAVYRDGYFQTDIGGGVDVKFCTVKSIKFPEIDTAGDSVAMLEIVLSPGFISPSGSKGLWQEPAESTN